MRRSAIPLDLPWGRAASVWLVWAAILCVAGTARAQSTTAGDDTRSGRLTAQQQDKATRLKPHEPSNAEQWARTIQDVFITGTFPWHPFFQSAYAGGGFALGAGYRAHVSSYNTLDLRGSYTPSGYTRLEAEYRAARLFDRRGTLSLLTGWREATQVGFYGVGFDQTSEEDRTNYSFRQPYVSATLDVRPARNWLLLAGGVEYSQWEQRPGEGSAPSVEEVFTPATLPGLIAKPTYLHARGTAAIDWRPSPGYARRGGYYGVTFHGYADSADAYSFRQVDYEAIQHVPLLRETWVLSFRGKVATTHTNDGELVPFFMLPSLGGVSSLRGFTSWRFRDLNSLLLQAEWRVLVNSFFDTALFVDAGKVTSRRSDLDLQSLESAYGIGFRLHSLTATPLRVELARSREGLVLVFSANAAF